MPQKVSQQGVRVVLGEPQPKPKPKPKKRPPAHGRRSAPPDLEMALIDSQPVGIDPFEEAAMGHTSLGLTTVWDGAAYG